MVRREVYSEDYLCHRVRELAEILRKRPSDLMGYSGTEYERLLFDLAVMSIQPRRGVIIVDSEGKKRMVGTTHDMIMSKYGRYIS